MADSKKILDTVPVDYNIPTITAVKIMTKKKKRWEKQAKRVEMLHWIVTYGLLKYFHGWTCGNVSTKQFLVRRTRNRGEIWEEKGAMKLSYIRKVILLIFTNPHGILHI